MAPEGAAGSNGHERSGLILTGELRCFNRRVAKSRAGVEFEVVSATLLVGNEMHTVGFYDAAAAERATGQPVSFDALAMPDGKKAPMCAIPVYVVTYVTKAGAAGYELKASTRQT